MCIRDRLSAFATMGSVYMEKVMGRANPSVGLVNNGAEETKGTPAYVEAHRLLKYKMCIRDRPCASPWRRAWNR